MKANWIFIGIAGAIFLGSGFSRASLDGTTPSTKYTVVEKGDPLTHVRQYLSNDNGTPFAVAWSGIHHPDFKKLLNLGDSKEMERLEKSRRPGRGNHWYVSNQLVVERWGSARKKWGRAYVPHLIPSGVEIDEIR